MNGPFQLELLTELTCLTCTKQQVIIVSISSTDLQVQKHSNKTARQMTSVGEENPDDATLMFIDLAIQQAKLALDSLEVPVSCVIVRDGKVIASGMNRTNETRNVKSHPQFCGGAPQRKGFKCTGGIMSSEAVSLFRNFYEQGNPDAPKPHRPLVHQAIQ